MLYGTSTTGVFKLNKDGSGFGFINSGWASNTDGISSVSGLIEGADGALYGTAGRSGESIVFTLGKDGNGYRILHSFGNEPPGGPRARLTEGRDGRLYGTTSLSTDSVFGLNKDGSGYHVLLTYNGSGHEPGLVEGSDGALYGTIVVSTSHITIYRVNKDGTAYRELYQILVDDWEGPFWSLVQGDDGAFYGTVMTASWDYGSYGGILFKVWPPETPDMLGVTNVNGSIKVRFTGEGGARYQVLRSSDLVTWMALPPITMPASGTYLYTDSAPPTGLAFYRAAWLP
jgi:hypothetical protein